MKKLLYILIFVPFAFYSCEKTTNNCPDLIQSVSIADFPMDFYGVNEIQVFDDELRINVNYGGGCEEHEFKLINDISPIDGVGQQMDVLYLSHNANNDVCFAQITEHQLCFDISDINGGGLYFSHPDSLYDLN
jgi:hypothetical protein|tara:strand:+ start:160 stop:558 length:399 start_codon:yes stop_codon:yes gene_type:complete